MWTHGPRGAVIAHVLCTMHIIIIARNKCGISTVRTAADQLIIFDTCSGTSIEVFPQDQVAIATSSEIVTVQHHPLQQKERDPARACAYLSTMSDSELAHAIECIEVHSTTTSLVQPDPEGSHAPQQQTSIVNTDTSDILPCDDSRGISTLAQKREAVLTAMVNSGDQHNAAPNAPSSSQDRGLGSHPRQDDDQHQGATGSQMEEVILASGSGRLVHQDNHEAASVAMEVDPSTRNPDLSRYDVSNVLSELDDRPHPAAGASAPSNRAPHQVSRGDYDMVRRGDASGIDDKFEQRARRRGWRSLNRWVIPGFYRHWEMISHMDSRGRDTRVGDFLSGRVSPSDVNCYDFETHLNVWVKDTIRETRNFVLPMIFERLERMSLNNLSLLGCNPELRNFDVVWARNREEFTYCVWASSAACIALENRISELMRSNPTSIPRVVRATLSWRDRLLLHTAVPWERYPKDVEAREEVAGSQLSSPECHLVAPTPAHYGRSGTIVIRPSLTDSHGNFVGYTTLPTSLRDELETYVPLAWRRFARTRRHRYERLIAEHQCEVELFQNYAVASRYPALPSWWNEVEVPYGFYNAVPFFATYRASDIEHNAPYVDVFLRSEWALSVAVHLMYEARGGRLWWIPFDVRQDIIRLQLTDSSSIEDAAEAGIRRQLAQLIGFIDSLAWSKIPRDGKLPSYPDMGDFALSGGSDPDRLNGITPVHRGADWVIFDAEEWCLHLPDEYFVPFIDAEAQHYQPEVPRRDRIRFYGEPSLGSGNLSARDGEEDPNLRRWQRQQLSRLRQSDAELATRVERNLPQSSQREASVPRISRPIGRSRDVGRHERSASLLAFLEREGITDIESFLASQQRHLSGDPFARRNDDAGPSNS